MYCQNKMNIIGYWISNKKRQKFNWLEFEETCRQNDLVLKKIDVESNIESQGPFHIFLHKLTDVLAHADDGDVNAIAITNRVQDYIKKNPDLIVIDPLDKIKNLRNRYKSYKMIEDGLKNDDDIFIPKFVDFNEISLKSIDVFREKDLKFPCICKPVLAHGSSDSHKMMLIFNEKSLLDLQLPCVVQEFVNHNAILYKVFVCGQNFHIVERPSFKNFYDKDCQLLNTISFSSHDISKSNSNSKWSIIEKEDVNLTIRPSHEIIKKVVDKIQKIFGLVLVGIDIVVENHTGKYAVIDVNVFPSYDGCPDFFYHLTSYMKKLLSHKNNISQTHQY